MREMPGGPKVYHSNRAMWSLAIATEGAVSAGTVGPLYVIDCGWAHAPDQCGGPRALMSTCQSAFPITVI